VSACVWRLAMVTWWLLLDIFRKGCLPTEENK